ncbi:MAG: sensor histidine kinase [Clostridia bacterium]
MTKNTNGRDDGVFDAKWHDDTMRVSFSRLSNDWKLAIISYEDALYETLNNVLGVIIALSFTMIVLLVFAISFAVQHLSSPVDKAVKMLKMLDLDDQLEHSDAADIKDDNDIEALVKKTVERQRMNDIILANQSRLASAGEMMSAITHQWKQPLNNINIVMGNLKDDIMSGELYEESALYAVSRVEKLTTGMSETLSDFTEYLKPDTQLVAFSVSDVINAAAELLRDKIRSAGITLEIHGDSTLISYGYRNSLYHVILNVLGNAIDAISEKGAGSGLISVDMHRSETEPGRLMIEIFNDGVPLSDSAQRNLFKPYYTTKSGSDGTGLGLAISRHFIEESMDGKIALENCSGGVRCTIVINEHTQDPQKRRQNETEV